MSEVAIHINRPGPMKTIVEKPDGESRWCFRCRKKTTFRFLVRGTVEPSYYEPTPSIQCEAGHSDGDLFPGRIREWDYE